MTTEIIDPDPRPRIASVTDTVTVQGWKCTACDYVTISIVPRCPECHSAVEESIFGPAGSVFASTVMRIRIPPRNPPFGLAYVLLDDGPRVLTHTLSDAPLPVGARVRLVPPPADADQNDLYSEEATSWQ